MKIPCCPNCHSTMKVTKLHCDDCDITIEGKFTSSKYASIDGETLAFMEEFILNRGNIKEIEKQLNISYPTVRGKIDNLVKVFEEIRENELTEIAKKEDITKRVTELSNKY